MATYAPPKPKRPALEMPMKPLFIPLRAEYYEAFKAGTKTCELRKAGGKWNPRTCPIGRDVILSKGYGKKNRIRGYIMGWSDAPVTQLKQSDRQAFYECYGIDEKRVFIIDIEVLP